MSNLFNLSKIMNINESSALRFVSKSGADEVYMFSMMNNLRSMNESITDISKKLYSSILEADSTAEENECFCEYFDEFKNAIKKFNNDVNELVSRFTINIDNIVDSNVDLIKDTSIYSTAEEFVYPMYKYTNLDNEKFPKFSPMKLYKKEFDYLGQLMQDIGPLASDSTKLQVIATVYNNLVKHMSNDWTQECIKDILGTTNQFSFAENVYNSFKSPEKEDVKVDKGVLYTAKETLLNYKKYTDSINCAANCLITEFDSIAEEIGDMVNRNKDGKLKIRTTTDGVADKDYQLNTYAMNQLDIFIKAKTNQISQLCNLYLVALSIKLDCIVEYILQCKSVLDKAKECIGCEKDSDDDHEDSDEHDDESNDSDEHDDESNDSDDDHEDSDEHNDLQAIQSKSEENQTMVDPAESLDDFDESYMFEYAIFNYERLVEQNDLTNYIKESLMLEEAEEKSDSEKKKDATLKSEDILAWFVQKIKEIFNKFNDLFINQTSKKIENLKKNTSKIKDGISSMSSENLDKFSTYKIDEDALNRYKAPRLDFNSMRDVLEGENSEIEFVKKYYHVDAKEDQSFVEAYKTSVVDKDEQHRDKNIDTGKLNNMLDWCLKFESVVNEIRQDTEVINSSYAEAMRDLKRQGQESINASYTMDSTNAEYFSEAETPDKASTGGGQGPKKAYKTYFKVCTSITAAKMTMAQLIFKEYYDCMKVFFNEPKVDDNK